MTDANSRTDDLTELSALAPLLADVLGLLSSDIALVLDPDGVIHKVVLGGLDTGGVRETSAEWVGRTFHDTVTDCSRQKVDELLRDLSAQGVSRPRHINHPGPDGSDIPVTYTAVRLGPQGPLLAVGRDLRAVRAIQQRLVDSQREMERSYWKLREAVPPPQATAGSHGPAKADARMLALVERTQDAVVITDPTGQVLCANPTLAYLLELDSNSPAQGQSLGRWLVGGCTIVQRTIDALLREGNLPLFEMGLRTERGRTLRVDVSVTLLPGETEPCVGFILRARIPLATGSPADRRGDEPLGQVH